MESEHCRALGMFLPRPQALAVTHLYVLHGLGSSGGLQQGHCAATKAATCHAAAINPGCRQCGLHQLVQLRAAHLIVIPAEETGRVGLEQVPPGPGDSLCPRCPSQEGLT